MLTASESKRIIETATGYLGKKWSKEFNCFHFVSEVYREASKRTPPPVSHNLMARDLEIHDATGCFTGYVVYLKWKRDKKLRAWSHVAILYDKETVIHCSYFFGKEVVITSLDEILELYDLTSAT